MSVLAAAAVALSSCNGFIYEDQGDCDPYYKVRFVYDMNMKYTDAFPQEVNSVTLYLVDPATGNVVWQKHESGEALHSADYLMDVDVEPGDYTLLAWAGDGHRTHFSIPEAQQHRLLQCTLLRERADDNSAIVTHDIDRLYHGKLENQDFPQEQGVHVYTVPLIKNTNDVQVVLQHISGAPVDHNKFVFTISDENGLMDWDNSLMPDEKITYHAWSVRSGTASIGDEGSGEDAPSRALGEFSAAVAEHTVARLMEDHRNTCRLTVYNKEKGEPVFSIPMIQYCLLVKSEHHRDMTDQEYLDRQDSYSMVFFLDEGDRWIDTHIFINSWKIVINSSKPL